ncbi:hypothetical protein GUITHDRAFT_138840 [Guillardia theta CCMP2712]|uniref:Uncharacterized protein n=1 Tax=Guillardia theta (strain CCMP2712) TaxID=905079 RepID=L1JAR5_GUITC|nr:hypothetical protein GUITHDRAFT_138840 [Guillardia theta CCMP2712]EKX45621.1 hypothetical protein GUITHDRAFT_138840 [Guillardia theta CCMP2712]|eukprot:XP_005832601.1 hypothetical protein GUITHDRAFT_138840 [Guillardia theta CCMP2712]
MLLKQHSTDVVANVDESSTPQAPALVQKDGWDFFPYYFCAETRPETRKRGGREEAGTRLCTLRHPQQSLEEQQQVDVIRRAEGDYVCVHSLCTFINAGESTSLALRNLYMQGISNFVRAIPGSVVRLSELHLCLKALVRALDRNLQDMEEEAEDLPSASQLEHVKSFHRRAKALDDLWDSLVVRGDTSVATSAVPSMLPTTSTAAGGDFPPADEGDEEEEMCFLDSSSSDPEPQDDAAAGGDLVPTGLKFLDGYERSSSANEISRMILKSPQGHGCNQVSCVVISQRVFVPVDSFIDFVSDNVEPCRNELMELIKTSRFLETVIISGASTAVIAAENLHKALKDVIQGIWKRFEEHRQVIQLNEHWDRCALEREQLSVDDAVDTCEKPSSNDSSIDRLLLNKGCLIESDSHSPEISSRASEISVQDDGRTRSSKLSIEQGRHDSGVSMLSDTCESESGEGGLFRGRSFFPVAGVWSRVSTLEQRVEEQHARISKLERKVTREARESSDSVEQDPLQERAVTRRRREHSLTSETPWQGGEAGSATDQSLLQHQLQERQAFRPSSYLSTSMSNALHALPRSIGVPQPGLSSPSGQRETGFRYFGSGRFSIFLDEFDRS